MNIAEMNFTLPAQLVMLEWGGQAGGAMPAATEAFSSGWFDTWRIGTERVIEPKGGLEAETSDESIYGAGTHRRAGVFYLDFLCRHQNPLGSPLIVTIEQIPVPTFVGAAFQAFTPRTVFIVESAGVASDLDSQAFMSRRFGIYFRMVRISFTYPASSPNDFYLSAVLRSN